MRQQLVKKKLPKRKMNKKISNNNNNNNNQSKGLFASIASFFGSKKDDPTAGNPQSDSGSDSDDYKYC